MSEVITLHPKRLKNKQRRLRQREKRKLVQPVAQIQPDGRSWLQTVLLTLGWIGTLIACAIVVRVAWLQGGNEDMDKWIAVSQLLIAEVAFIFLLATAEKMLRRRKYLSAFLSMGLVLGLGTLALKNFEQWFAITTTTSNQERVGTRLEEMERRYDVPELTTRWNEARDDYKTVQRMVQSECEKATGKGTACERHSQKTVPNQKEKEDRAFKDLQTAKAKARSDVDQEMAVVVNKSSEMIGFRKFLPLLAPCLVLLGSI